MDSRLPGTGRRTRLCRAGECALIDDLASAIRRGQSRSLELRGEAGIGTALLDYLVASRPATAPAVGTGLSLAIIAVLFPLPRSPCSGRSAWSSRELADVLVHGRGLHVGPVGTAPPSGRARNDPTNVETIGRNSQPTTEQAGGRAPTVMLVRNSPEAAMTTRTGSAGPAPPRRAPRSQPRPAVTPSTPTSGCRSHRRARVDASKGARTKVRTTAARHRDGVQSFNSLPHLAMLETFRCWCQCRSRRRAQRA